MYKILEHSADEKFHASGDTIEEALRSAVDAFSEIVGNEETGMYTHTIEVESEGLEPLLYDFIDEMIFLQDTEGVAIAEAEKIEVEELETGWKLEASLKADPVTRTTALLDVKAPTYNEMKVDYEDGKWILEAVIDV